MTDLQEKVQQWGADKGIISANKPLKQLEKTQEELTELRDAIVRLQLLRELEQTEEVRLRFTVEITAMIDGFGDVEVTLILLRKIMGVSYDECLFHAYSEIKERKGKMVDGIFEKEGA